jgi:HSP20 family protein
VKHEHAECHVAQGGCDEMSITPYEPMRQMDNWRRSFDRFFDDLPFASRMNDWQTSHRVDVIERENEIVASCEIPGLESKNDVHIEVDQNMLTLTGALQRAEESKEEHVHRRERYAGKFQRTIALPTSIQAEMVTATYKNGVLEIRLPKLKSESRRKIDVQFH